MRTACDVTNVVEAANTEGRQERLENMLVQLEQCQKALQVRHQRSGSCCIVILSGCSCVPACLPACVCDASCAGCWC